MEFKNFDSVVEQVVSIPQRRVVAVAGAADAEVIASVIDAYEQSVAEPILVGEKDKIISILQSMDKNPADYNVVQTIEGMDEAQTAVELIKSGDANFLMKGMIETASLLRPVVNKENGLRTGGVMSHIAFNSFSTYHKIIVNTDGGMMTYPTLEQKIDIVKNAVNTFHALGYECPKVACLCAIEKVNPKMPETVEADAIMRACENGELGNCFVAGPISYDVAMSADIAAHKGYNCEHCGNFDILLVPNIHAGNILGKTWTVSCKAKMAGLVVGARVPIVLTSRGSSAEEKFLSISLAGLVAARSEA
ncbi:MAG: phosphate butyryltransferase [Clostridiales bacterium]|nr:phosphate butyryltransferase [Clostridiales bacterium]